MGTGLKLVFVPDSRARQRGRRRSDDGELEVIGPDTRQRILATTGVPFRYICKLQADPTVGNCTGTIIAANKVLTAAHCVDSVDAADIEVIPAKRQAGTDSTAEPFGRIGVTRIDFNAGFVGCGDLDYAVLTLSKSVATQIGTWPRLRAMDPAQILRIKKTNLAGFPRDLNALGDEMYWTYDNVLTAVGATLEYEHDTFEGMSGSPMWIRWQDVRSIIGIHQCADQPGPPVGNKGLLFTAGILADIDGWVRT
jgi:V8-like Glu-specific endopeptidase